MKIALHIAATIVGFTIAAVVVYLVFGNASEQGAQQDGAAPTSVGASDASLCGSVPPGGVRAPAAIEQASENLPPIIDPRGVEVAVDASNTAQVQWFARVHAASGLCIDEIRITDDRVTIAMSTVGGIDDVAASSYAAAVVAAANQAPLQRPVVNLTAVVGDSQRTALVSRRAWAAFAAQRRGKVAGATMAQLAAFRRQTGYGPADLRIVGWG